MFSPSSWRHPSLTACALTFSLVALAGCDRSAQSAARAGDAVALNPSTATTGASAGATSTGTGTGASNGTSGGTASSGGATTPTSGGTNSGSGTGGGTTTGTGSGSGSSTPSGTGSTGTGTSTTGTSTTSAETSPTSAKCKAVFATGTGITQSQQPKCGPGGSDYSNTYRVTAGGSGNDAWYVFEPITPQPATAPLAIVTHGYFEFSGYATMQGLIEHTVRHGTVVIYPRWQTGPTMPCAGPGDISPCVTSEVNGIKGALAYLQADTSRVQPDLTRTSYFGFSFGGILTTIIANRWEALGLPKPRAIFLDDPHDGGYTSAHELSLDDFLTGIPKTTLIECHSGTHGVFDDNYTGTGGPVTDEGQPKKDAACNAVFEKMFRVPVQNKSLVLTSEDGHGAPALTSDHGVCTGAGSAAASVLSSASDAYDWGFCWKVWDALRSCALNGTYCEYALGDTPEHRHIGTWSDGVPIIGLKIQDDAPIRGQPVPAPAPAP